ncbi:MAG: hypothetical protein ABFR53_00440 [Actinomycetota bacterium]
MIRRSMRRRGYWLVVGLALTTMIIIGTVAVGIAATPSTSEIELVLDGEATEFRYGDLTQELPVDDSTCDVADGSVDGPIMSMDGTIIDKSGLWISDETLGYHRHRDHYGFGVNSGSREEVCGVIDSLTDDTTDALTLGLGTALDGQMIESVDLDLETDLDAQVRIDYLDGTDVAFTEFYDFPDDAAEIRDDTGRSSSVRLTAPQEPANQGVLFDGLRISMVTERMSLTGGATWDDPSMHRTVFHLTEALPGVSIDATTNGSDGDSFLVGEPITWSYLVTNTGDTPLIDIAVTDVPLGAISCDATELAIGASTTCSLAGSAEAGLFENTGTVTATSPGGVATEASDASSYFGLLGCGDSDSTGGPGLEDDPLGAFYNGPTKDDAECGAAVAITTSNTTDTGGEQTVDVAAPPGFTWDGVTGLVTIQWDIEVPTDDGIARTVQQLIPGDPLSEVVVPWCEQAVGTSLSGSGWSYELDPVTTYPTATGSGDTCLVSQSTTTVDVGGDVFTQTTEVFYIWNDPRLIR